MCLMQHAATVDKVTLQMPAQTTLDQTYNGHSVFLRRLVSGLTAVVVIESGFVSESHIEASGKA